MWLCQISVNVLCSYMKLLPAILPCSRVFRIGGIKTSCLPSLGHIQSSNLPNTESNEVKFKEIELKRIPWK